MSAVLFARESFNVGVMHNRAGSFVQKPRPYPNVVNYCVGQILETHIARDAVAVQKRNHFVRLVGRLGQSACDCQALELGNGRALYNSNDVREAREVSGDIAFIRDARVVEGVSWQQSLPRCARGQKDKAHRELLHFSTLHAPLSQSMGAG